jgi:hypothetical protein
MFKNKRGPLVVFNIVLSILQTGMFVAVFVLEKYAAEKMGVARYLIYKKQWFENTMFTASLRNLYLFIFILGVVICFGLLVRKAKRKEKATSFFVAIIANMIGAIILQFKVDLASYHFFVVIIMVIVAIQYWKILLIGVNRTKSKKQ